MHTHTQLVTLTDKLTDHHPDYSVNLQMKSDNLQIYLQVEVITETRHLILVTVTEARARQVVVSSPSKAPTR